MMKRAGFSALCAAIVAGMPLFDVANSGGTDPTQDATPADLEAAFQNPPNAAKPWVYWYWMQANATREGITRDLEAMAAAGIGGSYLMPIGHAGSYRYVLRRYFEEFDNVGLYICPGETLATSRQLEWFRDVIFKAAKESEKSPLLIIRDWTLNMNFREQIPTLYENCYSELKHNDETFTSPVPDHWERYLTEKFHSAEVGQHLYRWYVVTGPISPGLQNLTATKFGNFWATVMLQNQGIDQILNARRRINDVPITLTREAGRTHQVYYSQPVDEYFFQRYKQRYGLPELTERISMPVTQYAEALSVGHQVTEAMTPDKVCDLLCELADEALESARAAQTAATDPATKAELDRFVSDTQMYVLATRALRHKVGAAILKARMLRASDADLGSEFLRHMQQSVEVYENLAQLTDRTYRNANDLMGRHWKQEGLTEFRNDLVTQRAWLAAFQQPKSVTLPSGAVRIEAEAMAGPWRIGNDRYTGFSGTGYAASYYAAVRPNPEPMTAKAHIPKAGEYTVWVHSSGSGQEK